MSSLIAGLQSDRSQRLIDWTIFGLGAASLVLALALTVVGVVRGDTVMAATRDHVVRL